VPKMVIPILRQANIFDNASAKRGFQPKTYKVTTKLNFFHVALSNFIKDHILPNKCL
jgi:hypothetical protein